MEVNMKAVTSDEKELSDIDGFLKIVGTLQKAVAHNNKQSRVKSNTTKVVTNDGRFLNSSSSSSSSAVSTPISERRVAVTSGSPRRPNFRKELEVVLNKMSELHWGGKIYSSGKEVFTRDFSVELDKLLALLQNVKGPLKDEVQTLKITSLQMDDVLRWLASVMDISGYGDDTDRQLIHWLIRELEDQETL
jgi:hypothetical protein